MDSKKLDLKQVATDAAQTERIVARLAGEVDDKTVQLWGEEFAASGGGKTPPTPDPAARG
jgi:hypothetical protein